MRPVAVCMADETMPCNQGAMQNLEDESSQAPLRKRALAKASQGLHKQPSCGGND